MAQWQMEPWRAAAEACPTCGHMIDNLDLYHGFQIWFEFQPHCPSQYAFRYACGDCPECALWFYAPQIVVASVPRKAAALYAYGNFDAEEVSLHRLRVGDVSWKVEHYVDAEPIVYGQCKTDKGAGWSAVAWLDIHTFPIIFADGEDGIRACQQQRAESVLPWLLQTSFWPPYEEV